MNIVNTRYGRMRTIETDSIVSRSLALYGEWAEDEISLIKNIITPGSIVLDVGAFIGTHTIAFSKFVGKHGKVYSFEPRSEFCKILNENISLNKCTNVIIMDVGLADYSHALARPTINISSTQNFGSYSLLGQHPTEKTPDGIMMQTIDSLQINEINFIKVDVEGMERKVLNGASKTIKKNRPIIYCECNSLFAGNELLEFCLENQYHVLGHLTSAYNQNNTNGITENIFGDAKEFGLVMVPEEKAGTEAGELIKNKLFRINSIDDLVLPMLNKPQYAYEVLAHSTTSASLGIAYASPVVISELSATKDQVRLLSEEISRIKATLSWQITKPLRLIAFLWRKMVRHEQPQP